MDLYDDSSQDQNNYSFSSAGSQSLDEQQQIDKDDDESHQRDQSIADSQPQHQQQQMYPQDAFSSSDQSDQLDFLFGLQSNESLRSIDQYHRNNIWYYPDFDNVQIQTISRQAKIQQKIQGWVYDVYYSHDKMPLDDLLIMLGQKRPGFRVDFRMLQMSFKIIHESLKNSPLQDDSSIPKILFGIKFAFQVDNVIQNKNLLLQFLKEIQRKNKHESFPLKDYVNLLINPVNLNKNKKTKIKQDRFPNIKYYCDKCYELITEQEKREMNLAKKVVKAQIHRILMQKYWIEQRVMEQKFDHKYRHAKPFYLARYLKKIALDMGQTGDGRFQTKKLTKSDVIWPNQYQSYIEETLLEFDR